MTDIKIGDTFRELNPYYPDESSKEFLVRTVVGIFYEDSKNNRLSTPLANPYVVKKVQIESDGAVYSDKVVFVMTAKEALSKMNKKLELLGNQQD